MYWQLLSIAAVVSPQDAQQRLCPHGAKATTAPADGLPSMWITLWRTVTIISDDVAWSIIGCRIDYCNSLFYGMTNRNLNKHVQNRADRIVCATGSQHISSSQQLHHLHWLPVRSRIQFKLSELCFRSRTLNQPQYISDTLHSYQPSTQDLLAVPRCKTVFGGRRFSVAAPRVWNSWFTTSTSKLWNFRNF